MLRRSKLLAPLSFLRLESPDLVRYQWIIPAIITCIMLSTYYFLPVEPQLFGDDGLVTRINGLLTTLIGFYIAALAAVATFPNETLDQEMKGRGPRLHYTRGGEPRIETLSRRRFLSILFGYSAFLSITIYGLAIVTSAVEPSFSKNIYREFCEFIWITIYGFMLSSLTVVTLLGLYYLTDRMHRE